MLMSDSCPSAQKVTYRFPARDNLPKLGLPECELTWYDGGLRPNIPFDMPEGKKFDGNGVCIFYGTKDTMVVGTYGYDPFLVSGREPKVPELCRIVKNDNQGLARANPNATEIALPTIGTKLSNPIQAP